MKLLPYRKKRNAYAQAVGGPIALAKEKSRHWMYTCIEESQIKIKEAALIVATAARDVHEMDALIKPHSYVLINQDPAILGMICVPNTDKYLRFAGDTRYLFDVESKSYMGFYKKHFRAPICSDTNLVWLDFCSSADKFLSTSDWTIWNQDYLRRPNRWLFVTHLIKTVPLNSIVLEYQNRFQRPVLSYAYKTSSEMCMIGIRS